MTRLVPVAPLSGRTGQARLNQARTRQDARTARSLGSERGLATPSPDGKGEIAPGPSMTIMPVDSYSTLGRSCEPAFKWILLGAGLRGGIRRSLSAGPRRAATRRAAHSPGREAHPRSSRRDRESVQRAPLFPCRFQARRGALSTCDQFWITHRATLP